MRPLVSIIVPSYNQGRFLGATLDSILSQDYRPLEVLVCDGASKDESVAVLEAYAAKHPELRWWSEPDQGPHEAVNRGLARATGAIAGIQSSDDLYLPGAISAAVAAFEANADAGLIYGDATFIDADGNAIGSPTNWLPFTLENFVCFSTFIMQSAAFFKLPLAQELGGWRKDYYAMDADLWMRMVFRTRALKIERQLCAYRFHEEQRDKQAMKIWDSYWRMVEDSEDIRRAPLSVRRAARAGRRILSERYNPWPGQVWRLRKQLWLGLLTWPPAYRAIAQPTVLVPGLARLSRLLGLCKPTPKKTSEAA